jgi:hypothetical protein
MVPKKQRQLGRVGCQTWNKLKRAAKLAGKTFTAWALGHLIERADEEIAKHKETVHAKGN